MSQVSSQTSSISSCDDYIIVLPDCFDTSRPLDKSAYNSATPLPDGDAPASVSCFEADVVLDSEEAESTSVVEKEGLCQDRQEKTEDTWPPTVTLTTSSSSNTVNQMLCASQTLDTVTLTPEVVPPPALYSPRLGT